jgi:hypothetical protein
MMKTFFVTILLLAGIIPLRAFSDGACSEKHQIEALRGYKKSFMPEHLQLTNDSILVFQYEKVLELGLDGSYMGAFKFENKVEAVNISYLPHLDLVAIVVWLGESGGNPVYQTRFYERDRKNYLIGYDYTQKTPVNSHFKQFIATWDGRLYINSWSSENVHKDGMLLQEVVLMPDSGGYEVAYRGKPFQVQRREFETNRSALKRRWVIPRDDQLLVINATQPILKRYAYENNDKRNALEEKEKTVSLNGWVHPYKSWVDLNKTEEELTFKDWFFSFSQNVGFYELSPASMELLWGYFVPLDKPVSDAGIEDPRHTLVLQLLDENGNLLVDEPVLKIDGGQLIGVLDRTAYVLLPRDANDIYSICKIQY